MTRYKEVYRAHSLVGVADGLLIKATVNEDVAMPRPLRPLDPSAGPAQAFAAELRKLYEEAGSPKFLQMARKTGKSRTALSEAVGGDHLPTWETVEAFVRACNSNPEAWRFKWAQTRDRIRVRTEQDGVAQAAPADDSAPAAPDLKETTEPTPPRRFGRWLVSYVVTALASAAMASAVTVLAVSNTSSGPSRQGATTARRSKAAVITVQNKVALGANRLIEDTTPAYLSARPAPFCATHGCKVPGTDVSSGAMLVAVCYVRGAEMFNYNLDSSEAKHNPNRADSTLWYKIVMPNRRSGYLSEVYVVPPDRGGKGLPTCR